jgi:hypothetical protein
MRFQILTASSTKTVFWDTAPMSLVVVRRFRGAYRLSGRRTLTQRCSQHLWNVGIPYEFALTRITEGCEFWVRVFQILSQIHQPKLKLRHYTPWGACGKRTYSSYSFLTSALYGGEWSASTPGPRFSPGTHCTGGWVVLRAGLDTEARVKILLPLPEIEPRSHSRPVRNQTLYWLS